MFVEFELHLQLPTQTWGGLFPCYEVGTSWRNFYRVLGGHDMVIRCNTSRFGFWIEFSAMFFCKELTRVRMSSLCFACTGAETWRFGVGLYWSALHIETIFLVAQVMSVLLHQSEDSLLLLKYRRVLRLVGSTYYIPRSTHTLQVASNLPRTDRSNGTGTEHPTGSNSNL